MVLLQITPDKFTTFDRKGNKPFPPSFLKTGVQYSKLLTYVKPVGFFKCFVSFYNGLYLLLKSNFFFQGLIWFKLLTVGILGVLFFSVLPVLIIMKDVGGREQDTELT